MPRLAQYLGRWIFHCGWYPDRKVRLFDRRKASWQGDYVHESVKVDGSLGHFEENLLHFTCDSLSGISIIGGGGNIGSSQVTKAGCGATISYDYRPTTQVPEPMSIAVLGAGLLGLGAARRLVAKS